MNHLNSVILEGNVVKQAELTEPKEGFKVCRFSIAVNRFTKNEKGDLANTKQDYKSIAKIEENKKNNNFLLTICCARDNIR